DADAVTVRANSPHHFAQKTRAVLEAPAIRPAASVRAQEFVTKITVAMLDIDEVKTKLPREHSRAVELLDDGLDFAVGENRIIVWQFQATIEQRMAIQDAGLWAIVSTGTAEATGMRELQADEQPVVGAG